MKIAALCLSLLLAAPAFATSPPAFRFPRNPGASTVALPNVDCTTGCTTNGLADFTRIDTHGYNTSTKRAWWYQDPLKKGRIVVKMTIADGDTDRFEGPSSLSTATAKCTLLTVPSERETCWTQENNPSAHIWPDSGYFKARIPRNRVQLFGAPADQKNGQTGWAAWGIYLGDGTNGDYFKCPTIGAYGPQLKNSDHWIKIGHFSTDPTNTFEQDFTFRKPGPTGIGIGCNGDTTGGGTPWFSTQLEQGATVTHTTVDASTARGQWHYFLEYTKWDSVATGEWKVWHSVGTMPDPGSSPIVSHLNVQTLGPTGAASTPLFGVYKSYESGRGWSARKLVPAVGCTNCLGVPNCIGSNGYDYNPAGGKKWGYCKGNPNGMGNYGWQWNIGYAPNPEDFPETFYLWGLGRGATATEALNLAEMCPGGVSTNFVASSNPAGTLVTITWAAPSGSSCTGALTNYDLRWDVNPITGDTFAGAFPIATSGSPATLATCPGTLYYFAIRAKFTGGIQYYPMANTFVQTSGVFNPQCGQGGDRPTGGGGARLMSIPGGAHFEYYDLSGRRLSAKPTRPGVFLERIVGSDGRVIGSRRFVVVR